MNTETQVQEHHEHDHFFVDIEGTVHPWPKDTITTEEIIALGGWPPSKAPSKSIEKTRNAPLSRGRSST